MKPFRFIIMIVFAYSLAMAIKNPFLSAEMIVFSGLALFILAFVAAVFIGHMQSDNVIDKSIQIATKLMDSDRIRADARAIRYLNGLGWSVAIPKEHEPGTLAFVACEVAKANAQEILVNKARMPESWYERVIRNSSAEGKRYLDKRIDQQGYVSASQAVIWVGIESKLVLLEASELAESRALMEALAGERRASWPLWRRALT